MIYKKTVTGTFIDRPNRFIAHVMIDGEIEVCHVKNTGRCRELLREGATVILEVSNNPSRKTKYDVIAVYKGDELINIDSQAPNKVFYEWVNDKKFIPSVTSVKPEFTYKSSRFDFYIQCPDRRIFVEVKGVTLEEDGVVLFPDAPTERGVKHVHELTEALNDGYESYVCFVIQMNTCKYFTPNAKTHPEFAKALRRARDLGVGVIALTCTVGQDSLSISGEAEVIL